MPTAQEQNEASIRLVLRLNIFLLGIIAIFILWRLPRAFARFSRASEWRQGVILRSIRLLKSSPRVVPSRTPSKLRKGKDIDADSSHTLYVPSLPPDVTTKGRLPTPPPNYPRHLPSCPALVRGIARLMQRRITPGFSLGQVVLLAIYLSILIYGSFHGSNPVTDPNRTGFISVSQVPFVFVFAAKNNILGWMLGIGYEKVSNSLQAGP